jgi:hypothetical protein
MVLAQGQGVAVGREGEEAARGREGREIGKELSLVYYLIDHVTCP